MKSSVAWCSVVLCCKEKAVWSASRERDGCSARDKVGWRSAAGNTAQLHRVIFSAMFTVLSGSFKCITFFWVDGLLTIFIGAVSFNVFFYYLTTTHRYF